MVSLSVLIVNLTNNTLHTENVRSVWKLSITYRIKMLFFHHLPTQKCIIQVRTIWSDKPPYKHQSAHKRVGVFIHILIDADFQMAYIFILSSAQALYNGVQSVRNSAIFRFITSVCKLNIYCCRLEYMCCWLPM